MGAKRINGVVEASPDNFFDKTWKHYWVAYTKSRQDKALIKEMSKEGLAYAAFYEKSVRIYPNKGTQTSLIPLLGGYVFFASDDTNDYETIKFSNRTLTIMEVQETKKLKEELCSMAMLISLSTEKVFLHPEIISGKTVTVKSGALQGFTGVVCDRKGFSELAVNLELFGQSVSTKIDVSAVELSFND